MYLLYHIWVGNVEDTIKYIYVYINESLVNLVMSV